MSEARAPEEAPKVCVLLVESNEAFLQVATDFLRRCPGLTVATTRRSDPKSLIGVRALQPQVIVLDLDMPDLGGLEAIRWLHDVMPSAGIIALTSLRGQAPVLAARAAGARDVVRKASLTTDLLPAIQRVNGTLHRCTKPGFALQPGAAS